MKDRLYILLERYLDKQATPKEVEELLELFQEPHAYEVLSEYYDDVWEQSSSEPSPLSIESKERVWAGIQQSIKRGEEMVQKAPNRFNWKRWTMTAAAVLLPILFLWIGLRVGSSYVKEGEELVVTVDAGQKANMTLPDGSKVWINSASSIKYDNSYNKKERKVYLSGEAYFEVAPKKECPFKVLTKDGLTVEALGTKFNVKAYDTDAEVQSTLLKGKVLVSHDEDGIVLEPNDKLTYDKTSRLWTKSRITKSDEVLAWMYNRLYFEGETLQDIANELERMYAVSIDFASEDIRGITFSGTIKNNSLQNILSLIVAVSPVPIEYSINDSTILIQQK